MKKIGLVLSIVALVSFASIFGYQAYEESRAGEAPPAPPPVAENIDENEPPEAHLFRIIVNTDSWFTTRVYETESMIEGQSGIGLPILAFTDKKTGLKRNVYMHNNSVIIEQVK
jgi:hypothetical protein